MSSDPFSQNHILQRSVEMTLRLLIFFFVLCLSAHGKPYKEYTPVVTWHGLGDPGWFTDDRIAKYLREELPGIYVKGLRFGNTIQDVWSSFFMDLNKQVEEACRTVTADPKLKGGFNLIGFSQAGQFARALVQRCSEARVRVLITLGAQHQGEYGIPYCNQDNSVCDILRRKMSSFFYNSKVQKNLVQAQYWKDPQNFDLYLKFNTFLPDINNEGPVKNETYKKNLAALDKFVMVHFNKDEMVRPLQSQWFGFYKPGQSKEIENFNETTLYKEDWIGLKQLDKRGAIDLLDIDAYHIKFTREWFVTTIVKKYLN